MARYKEAERAKAYDLFVVKGIDSLDTIGGMVKLGRTTLRKWWDEVGQGAMKDRRQRCEQAKKLYIESGVTDIADLCRQARISEELFAVIYDPSWDAQRAGHIAQHPPLYSTGQKLEQAADLLLKKARDAEMVTPGDVTALVSLANALEKFKTGEYKLEMILVGITDFAEYFRAHAKSLGIKPPHVKALDKLFDHYRRHIVKKLKATL